MLAHKIAGAAGVFGFDALGRAAREVEEQIDAAVRALAAHDRYLSVLDPDTPVLDQARAQIEMATAPREGDPRHVTGFELKRGRPA